MTSHQCPSAPLSTYALRWQYLSEPRPVVASPPSARHLSTTVQSKFNTFYFSKILFSGTVFILTLMSLKGRLRASFRELADLAQYKLSKWKLQFLTSSAYKRYYVCKQSSSQSIYLIICPTKFFPFQGLASRRDGEGLWTIPPDWIPWVLGAFGAVLLIAVGVLAYLIVRIRRELATRFRLGRLFALFNSLLAFPLILLPLVTI